MVTSMLVAVSIISCGKPTAHDEFLNVPQNEIEITFNPTGDNHKKSMAVTSIFQEGNIDFISFKPNKDGDGLLVIPTTIYTLEDKWLVYDPGHDKSNILLYDQDGDFLTYIGKKGKGPGEYVATGLCRINHIKRRIEIVDGATNYILWYSFDGSYIKSIKLPMIFTDFIPNPSGPGYYLYTLDNYNTGFMPEYTLDKDYVITMVDSLFNPYHGIEEIYLDPSANPSRNNGQKLFQYDNSVGFINNYSNDLYTIKNDEVHSLVSFRINGIKFQPKEYIKTADGIGF